MASVQAASHAPGGPQIVGGAGLLSLAVAALRFSPWPSTPPLPAPQERIIALDEVSWHDHAGDCWIILYDRVYDITTLLDKVRFIPLLPVLTSIFDLILFLLF